jgi:hypothetical protein
MIEQYITRTNELNQPIIIQNKLNLFNLFKFFFLIFFQNDIFVFFTTEIAQYFIIFLILLFLNYSEYLLDVFYLYKELSLYSFTFFS